MSYGPTLIDLAVREAIYTQTLLTGTPPTVEQVADGCGFDAPTVSGAFRRLAESHVVVLKPGTTQLWSAPPFSAVTTSFRVKTVSGAWYAPCAWDMFGVPAVLKSDAVLDARCAWSGEALPVVVKNGAVSGDGLVHFEVPARDFWVDIFYT